MKRKILASAKSEDTIYVLIANDSGKFQGWG